MPKLTTCETIQCQHIALSNSVWKPLRGPVYDSPLAVCDYRTVKKEDMVPTDIIFPDYLGETYSFWPNAEHRFYYVDGQEAHEAWMVKCFDSATHANPDVAQCMCTLFLKRRRRDANASSRTLYILSLY